MLVVYDRCTLETACADSTRLQTICNAPFMFVSYNELKWSLAAVVMINTKIKFLRYAKIIHVSRHLNSPNMTNAPNSLKIHSRFRLGTLSAIHFTFRGGQS